MDVVLGASSECSSGCESGWTLYLEHSSSFCKNNNANTKVKKMAGFYEEGTKNGGCFREDYYYNDNNNVEEVEEEDLSMVSDASSGPPHFDHDIYDDHDDEEVEEGFCYCGKKRSVKLSTLHHNQCYNAQDFTLDDTASSPIFTSKKIGDNKGSSLKRMIDYSSQGFSTNHFHQGRSSNFQEHYGYIQPPLSTKQFRQNQWS